MQKPPLGPPLSLLTRHLVRLLEDALLLLPHHLLRASGLPHQGAVSCGRSILGATISPGQSTHTPTTALGTVLHGDGTQATVLQRLL